MGPGVGQWRGRGLLGGPGGGFLPVLGGGTPRPPLREAARPRPPRPPQAGLTRGVTHGPSATPTNRVGHPAVLAGDGPGGWAMAGSRLVGRPGAMFSAVVDR